MNFSSKKSKFQILSNDLKNCHRCKGLNIKNLTECTPGFGNLYSNIFIIGQSLCRKCMITKIPFTGGSGLLLDKAFEISKIPKCKIFVTNVVHCHTPNNRKSFPEEIFNCKEYLFRELEIVKPNVVILLGQDAITSILGTNSWPIVIGKKIPLKNYVVYPLYHPSYIMKKDKETREGYINNLASIIKTEYRDNL